MVRAINHVTLSVRDLEASFAFYAEVLGLRPVARWYKGAYLEAGGDWICLSLDVETRSGSLGEYTHLAFSVDAASFGEAGRQWVQTLSWPDIAARLIEVSGI